MKRAKKTSQFKDKMENANRQLIHRRYVSLIYNAFQNRTTDDLSKELNLYSNYQIDMKIEDPDSDMGSWDLVLFKEEDSLKSVDLIFIEVKTSVKGLNLESEIRKKIGKTISTLGKGEDQKLRIKMGVDERIISCIEFVIASPPDSQGDLRNKFQSTTKICPIILWQIDDSSAVQNDQFVGKLSISYISEPNIGVYPLCRSRTAKKGIGCECFLLKDSEEWYFKDHKKEDKQGNLRKHNREKMNEFLRNTNITSKALIPGSAPMIENVVNETVLLTNGPLSGKGEKVSKTKDEWKRLVDEYFNEYGLFNYNSTTTYGEFYIEQLIGADILIPSELSPNSFFVKKISGPPDKILQKIIKKVISYEGQNRTRTLQDDIYD